MTGYTPLKITSPETGLVQNREDFLLPDDAYPILQNAYVWRERIRRKNAFELLGRLQRNFTTLSLGDSGASPWTFIIYSTITPAFLLPNQPNPGIVPGSVVITIGTIVFTDQGNGTLTSPTLGNSGIINYATGSVTLTHTAGAGIATTITFSYYPNLPVMGIRQKENQNSTNDTTVFFDQVYAYVYNGVSNTFQEFLPGTTWTGQNYEFFWTTNYWVGTGNLKIFWATNFSNSGDPIRYTNGGMATNWVNFQPIINAAGEILVQALCILPYRGRLVVFNTIETDGPHTNRIRWAAIGNPFTVVSPIVTTVNADAWLDDKRGQGGFLDIPTSEDIVSVGFVRDNIVIYCERSTWQLRYTGRTIAPFQIERVNSELGAQSTFSTVQFDTSLVGIGDKGIVECDSYSSTRIDIKIPDFVFNFQDSNNGYERIQGIRDFKNRLAYWTYCSSSSSGNFPDSRLVYNYENDSWAIFTDSLTVLGNFQQPSSRTWINTPEPWIQCKFTWTTPNATIPVILGGNQQGFIEYLTTELTTNEPSLYISNITFPASLLTTITSPSHNLQSGQIITISNIPIGTPYSDLNGGIYFVVIIDVNNFTINTYNALSGQFSTPVIESEGTFIGYGLISVLDNFNVTSKKFNFLDDGQNIQMGYLDILMNASSNPNPGAMSLNVYVDYNNDDATNTLPQNVIADGLPDDLPDNFFNSTIPTTSSTGQPGDKFWQRVFCPTRGSFLTLQYTFSNLQMSNGQQSTDIQIDAQILWLRRSGRMVQNI